MFFIFGSPRSGTTLMAQSLNQHDDICVPDETDFIIPIAFILDTVKEPSVGKSLIARLICHAKSFPSSVGEYLTAERVEAIVSGSAYELSDILNNIYSEVAAANGARIAGDKSPNDLNFMRIVVKQGMFQKDNRIVHIVRDVRDVMASLNRLNWANNLDLYFPRFWSNSNLYLHELFKHDTEKYFLVRYEDFVSDYSGWLRKICTFLGVPYQEKMTNHEERHTRYRSMSHHEHLFNPVTSARTGLYRDLLTKEAVANYQKQSHEALLKFGYDLD